MRPDGYRIAVRAVHRHGDSVGVRRQGDARRRRPHRDPFGHEDSAHRLRDVLVFAPDQPRRLLDDRDLGTKSAVHLRELEADVAATDDDQMARQPIERDHARVGEERHVLDARHVRHECPPADVEEDPRRAEQLIADADGRRALEARVPPQQRAAFHAEEPLLVTGAGVGGHRPGALGDPLHVDGNAALQDDAEVGRAARDVRGVRARHQCLGRHAAGVDAGAADQFPLDDARRSCPRPSTVRPARGRPVLRR